MTLTTSRPNFSIFVPSYTVRHQASAPGLTSSIPIYLLVSSDAAETSLAAQKRVTKRNIPRFLYKECTVYTTFFVPFSHPLRGNRFLVRLKKFILVFEDNC